MLFRRKIEPACEYCAHGRLMEEELLCKKKGLVSEFSPCRRFKYDPLKRVPPRHAQLRHELLDPEDFKLE